MTFLALEGRTALRQRLGQASECYYRTATHGVRYAVLVAVSVVWSSGAHIMRAFGEEFWT